MPISTPAQISFPLDIPDVDVLATEQTRDGKFGMVQNHERAPLQLNEQKEQFPAN